MQLRTRIVVAAGVVAAMLALGAAGAPFEMLVTNADVAPDGAEVAPFLDGIMLGPALGA